MKTFQGKLLIIGLVLSLITTAIVVSGWYQKNYINDLTGSWEIEFETKETNYSDYIGLVVQHRVELTQEENSVTGIGEAWAANGEYLPVNRHRKLELTGRVKGELFTGTFTFHGKNRKTQGSFTCTISIDGKSFEGEFSSTAADSKGPVRGRFRPL